MAEGKEAAVFISYAHQDGAALAAQLQRDLARLGWDVWLDSARLTGGASWTVEIEQALDRSDFVVAILSRGTAARFMHYFKAMARDRVGSYHTRGDLETFLNRWVAGYVNLDDQSSPVISAKRPLREARVDVSEDPGKPGAYRVVAFLRPYFQLDDLSVSLRVVGRIP